jgi:hypothetical protein
MSNPKAPGSPAGRKSSALSKAPGAPKRKKRGLRQFQMPGARNLSDSLAEAATHSITKDGEESRAPMVGGRRRRKSKRKSRKKSHKKKRKTKRRRKSRKKKTKRRRRR